MFQKPTIFDVKIHKIENVLHIKLGCGEWFNNFTWVTQRLWLRYMDMVNKLRAWGRQPLVGFFSYKVEYYEGFVLLWVCIPKDTCLNEIGLCDQITIIILGITINIVIGERGVGGYVII